jgi:alkaline phosphatase D
MMPPLTLLSLIHRVPLGWSLLAIAVGVMFSGCGSPPMPGQGILVGEVTDTTAVAQVRLTESDKLIEGDVPGVAGVVEFTLFDEAGNSEMFREQVKAVEYRDFIARIVFKDLEPGKRYVLETRIGTSPQRLIQGPTAEFRTLSGASVSTDFQFVVVTCMNYAKFHGDDRIDREIHLLHNATELADPYDGPDKHLGYPGLETILKIKPDFFVGAGDTVYYDTPKEPRAETIPEMRQKWHEQFVQPRFRDLFAKVPTFWEVDDHDYRIDDGDNSGDYAPSPGEARRMLLEQLPFTAHGDTDFKTYRTYRVTQDLQVWFVENRMYRSPNAMPDGPDKSIWGIEQKAWLKQTLAESNATFKVLISPTPMIGPDSLHKTDNHTNIGGFRYERDDFFEWLLESEVDIGKFFIITGDRHWQYHSISPEGIQEFSCGALTDTNSRLGVNPGSPDGTDPEGHITQVYTQSPKSGGFLLVKVTGGTTGEKPILTFDFRDEKGVQLYTQSKR